MARTSNRTTSKRPTPDGRRWLTPGPVGVALGLLLIALAASGEGTPAALAVGENSITTPDTGEPEGMVASGASLVLDASGFPVIAYNELNGADLVLMHCDDANCATGSDSVTSPDTAGAIGGSASLVLDAAGFPVVSYYDDTNDDLKILHCDDPDCAPGGDSITTPDAAGNVGQYTSLALDASGFPVVSYYDDTNDELRLLHCDDVNCAPGGDSVTTPDTAGIVGQYTSLALDASGFPVVSYYNASNDDLKILHCGDANCEPGGDIIRTIDAAGDVGQHTSIALDASGFPVVSYFDNTNDDLKLLHCFDANCGVGSSVNAIEPLNGSGEFTSLELDANGFPVISFLTSYNLYGESTLDLRLVHCDDADCAEGGDAITSPDPSATSAGWYTSLALDASGFPAVVHQDIDRDELRLVHCADENCSTQAGVEIIAGGRQAASFSAVSLALAPGGEPVVAYYDSINRELRLLRCDDANCAPGGDTITTPDPALSVGDWASLALDGSGFPVVSYYDGINADLKILHCDDPSCAPGGDSVTSPDTVGYVGAYTSLSLDTNGFPVVSYFDSSNEDLKLLHCDDPNCAPGGDSISSPDTTFSVGRYSSLELDANGFPVVSYYDTTLQDLKVLHCDDPNCAFGNEWITRPDPDPGLIGQYPSLELDASGFPVISYWKDSPNQGNVYELRLLHCYDPNCIPGGDSITPIEDAEAIVSDLELTASGLPVVAYYEFRNRSLAVRLCDDPNCVTVGDSITHPYSEGINGAALKLDASGYPVVSFANRAEVFVEPPSPEDDLHLLHCGTPNCIPPGEQATPGCVVVGSDCDSLPNVMPPNGQHQGPSNTSYFLDNCTGVANGSQLNADGNFVDLPSSKSYDDLTWPNSDASGDACDTDDDNDGRPDADEIAGTGCGAFTTPTDWRVRDTDGDRLLDGAECTLGTDPMGINPAPPACSVAGDLDADGVSSAREICYYNTDPNIANTDGDLCSDGKEVASVNADTTVNATDLSQVAQHFGPSTGPNYIVDFDITKDGMINATDLSQVAQRFGACP